MKFVPSSLFSSGMWLVVSLALAMPAVAQHQVSREERHEARSPDGDARWSAAGPLPAEPRQVMDETEMGPPVPWRRGKRMTREERRQLRQDINEAGRELYGPPVRKKHQHH